jgi:gliding motility-associated-like protein
VQQPSCGQFNGSIQGMSISYNTGIQIYWENESGAIVSRQLDLTGAGPGKYRLVFQDTTGGCVDSTGIYALVNQSGPTVDIGNAVITNASCHNANGGIANVTYSNVSGAPYYQWVDSLGHAVGGGPSLSGVPAGSYRLKFKDAGSCDTIITSPFVVGDDGEISLDSSSLSVQPSKCSGPTGSITGLKIQGAFSYDWISIPDRTPMGNSTDLTGVAPGQYRLIATSALGCTDSSRLFVIGLTPIQTLSVTAVASHQETCNRKDGFVQITGTLPDPSGFTFSWVDSSTQQQIGTGLSIDQLAAGTYYCQATDANGCTQIFFTSRLADVPAPVISSDPSLAYPDTCATKSGGVSPPNITGSAPYSYAWYDASGDSISAGAGLSGVGSGTYYVSVTDANGCPSKSGSFVVGDIDIDLAAPVYPAEYVLKDATASLVPGNAEPGTYELYANPNSMTPDQTSPNGVFNVGPIGDDTTVYVLLRKGECNSVMVGVSIQVLLTLDLIVPNAFSPNGDGHNDVFRIKNPGLVKQFEMEVFNRWGQLVFTTKDPYQGWTGYAGGQASPVGTYVWSIHYTDILGNQKDRRGTVILIR